MQIIPALANSGGVSVSSSSSSSPRAKLDAYVSDNHTTLKSNLLRTLQLRHMTSSSSSSSSSSQQLRFDDTAFVSSSFNEFLVVVDTRQFTLFRDLVKQLSTSDANVKFDSLRVKANLCFYLCRVSANGGGGGGGGGDKLLLNRLEVNFMLGYARLRMAATIDSIDLRVDANLDARRGDSPFASSCFMSTRSNETTTDGDRTLTTSMDDDGNDSGGGGGGGDDEAMDEVRVVIDEQFVPFSNAGNMDVEVECFLTVADHQLVQRINGSAPTVCTSAFLSSVRMNVQFNIIQQFCCIYFV